MPPPGVRLVPRADQGAISVRQATDIRFLLLHQAGRHQTLIGNGAAAKLESVAYARLLLLGGFSSAIIRRAQGQSRSDQGRTGASKLPIGAHLFVPSRYMAEPPSDDRCHTRQGGPDARPSRQGVAGERRAGKALPPFGFHPLPKTQSPGFCCSEQRSWLVGPAGLGPGAPDGVGTLPGSASLGGAGAEEEIRCASLSS